MLPADILHQLLQACFADANSNSSEIASTQACPGKSVVAGDLDVYLHSTTPTADGRDRWLGKLCQSQGQTASKAAVSADSTSKCVAMRDLLGTLRAAQAREKSAELYLVARSPSALSVTFPAEGYGDWAPVDPEKIEKESAKEIEKMKVRQTSEYTEPLG